MVDSRRQSLSPYNHVLSTCTVSKPRSNENVVALRWLRTNIKRFSLLASVKDGYILSVAFRIMPSSMNVVMSRLETSATAASLVLAVQSGIETARRVFASTTQSRGFLPTFPFILVETSPLRPRHAETARITPKLASQSPDRNDAPYPAAKAPRGRFPSLLNRLRLFDDCLAF